MTDEHLDYLADQFLKKDLLTPDDLKKQLESTELDSTLSLKPGSNFGRFRISRLIGSGAIGEVYLARDTTLQRDVALKIMTKATNWDIERFYREARTVAKLDHPNIVRVYEIGKIDTNHYISMQYIKGKNFDDARPTVDQALQYMVVIARALDYAHSHGIIHRDIKPSNILVDDYGKTYLVDFGIAKQVTATEKTLSVTGMIIGTPAFMSPEQASGEVSSVNYLSDIYGLGATLYYLVTGSRPHEGKTVFETVENIIKRDPAEPRKLNPKVSKDVEAIILKAMAREQLRRYASAGEFADDIVSYLKGGPIKAKRTSTVKRTIRRLYKSRTKVAVILCLLVAISLAIFFFIQTRKPNIYPLLFESENLIQEFEKHLMVENIDITTKYDLLARAERLAKEALAKDNRSHEAYWQLARIYAHRFEFDLAIQYIEKALGIEPQARYYFEHALLYSKVLFYNYYEQANLFYKETLEEEYERSRTVYDMVLSSLTDALNIGGLPSWQQIYAEAQLKKITLQDAVSRLTQILDKIDSVNDRVQIQIYLADLYSLFNYHDKAIKIYNDILRFKRSSYDTYLGLGNSYHGRAQDILSEEDLDQALECFRKAALINPQIANAKIMTAKVLVDKALVRIRAGRDPLEYINEAESICEQLVEVNPDRPVHLLYLGTIHSRKARWLMTQGFDISEYLRKSQDLFEKALKLDPRSFASYCALADHYTFILENKDPLVVQESDCDRIINAYQDAIKLRPGSLWAHYMLAEALLRKAELLVEKDKDPNPVINQAIQYCDDAKKKREILLHLYYTNKGRAQLAIAAYLQKKGVDFFQHVNDALEYLNHAISHDDNYALAYFFRFTAHSALQDLRQAKDGLEKYLELEPLQRIYFGPILEELKRRLQDQDQK